MKKSITGLFDVHCHIVYGVDDGSKNPQMTRKMIETAYSEGVRNIISTPHFNIDAFGRSKEELLESIEKVRQLVKEMYPDMNIYSGSEIFYKKDVTENDFADKKVLTLAGSRYVLMEFVTSVTYEYIREAVRCAVQYGYKPIIAHVNRFDCLLDDINKVYELHDEGVYIQINAGTILGYEGRGMKKYAKQLLKDEVVDFVGTDAHRDEGLRTMKIQEAARYVEKKFGSEYMERIFMENPKAVVEDKNLYN